MINLYHNPMTRSLRVLWLLEELGLEYTLQSTDFVPPADGEIFAQNTPTGRFPTLEDDNLVLCESCSNITTSAGESQQLRHPEWGRN
jgi:glutathione S-transferase